MCFIERGTPCRVRQDQGPEGLTGLPTPVISKLVDGLMHMARTHIDKRSRLVSAAVGLAYQNRVEAPSLSHIPPQAKVPLGPGYYSFQTQPQIGHPPPQLLPSPLSPPP